MTEREAFLAEFRALVEKDPVLSFRLCFYITATAMRVLMNMNDETENRPSDR